MKTTFFKNIVLVVSLVFIFGTVTTFFTSCDKDNYEETPKPEPEPEPKPEPEPEPKTTISEAKETEDISNDKLTKLSKVYEIETKVGDKLTAKAKVSITSETTYDSEIVAVDIKELVPNMGKRSSMPSLPIGEMKKEVTENLISQVADTTKYQVIEKYSAENASWLVTSKRDSVIIKIDGKDAIFSGDVISVSNFVADQTKLEVKREPVGQYFEAKLPMSVEIKHPRDQKLVKNFVQPYKIDKSLDRFVSWNVTKRELVGHTGRLEWEDVYFLSEAKKFQREHTYTKNRIGEAVQSLGRFEYPAIETWINIPKPNSYGDPIGEIISNVYQGEINIIVTYHNNLLCFDEMGSGTKRWIEKASTIINGTKIDFPFVDIPLYQITVDRKRSFIEKDEANRTEKFLWNTEITYKIVNSETNDLIRKEVITNSDYVIYPIVAP